MTGAALDFGSLDEALRRADPHVNLQRSIAADPEFVQQHPEVVKAAAAAKPTGAINLMRSAGPISDAYIMAADRVGVIAGPQGSGKTVASIKKALVEAQRIRPGADGVRRYKLGVWRQKYDNLWKATIPSYWKILPKDLSGSSWTGASPRAAKHVVRFEDRWGPVETTVDFMAFGDVADPEDLRGLEFTDVWLNEIDTLPPDLFTWLIGRVGREPPPEVTGRLGRVFGDMNAPDVLNWTYKKFYETPIEGYVLHRQPGGMDPGAENLEAYGGGHGYYIQQIELNADNPWWIRRMVHGIPGVSRSTDLVYDKFDETRMISNGSIKIEPHLPIVVGIDGGLTPSAVYIQETGDGQMRILAEIALERGGVEELGDAMLVLEGRRFKDCDFADRCDPSMNAGEDKDTDDQRAQRVSKGSDRQRLAKKLEREVLLAVSQEPTRRWDAVRAKIKLNLGPSRPGLLLDPSCHGLKRGFLQTYQYRKLRGTNDLSSIQPTFDTHVHDALQYAALECGSDTARKRKRDLDQKREKKRKENREAKRYHPFARRRA